MFTNPTRQLIVPDDPMGPMGHILYGNPPERPEDIRDFMRWIRANLFGGRILLYHGGPSRATIGVDGVLPTSSARRNSYQPSNGWTHWSVFKSHAEMFGMANGPGPQVWSCDFGVHELKPDPDQLANKRAAGVKCGSNLAWSLCVGHAARFRGRVHPGRLTRVA